MIAPVLGKFRDELHGLFRIVVGFLFWSHGAGKLFGIMGREEPVELLSAFGVAGVSEVALRTGSRRDHVLPRAQHAAQGSAHPGAIPRH